MSDLNCDLFNWNFHTSSYLKFCLQREHDLLVMLVTIVCACYGFGALLIICETGHQFSSAFEELADNIKAFDWHLFPLEIQRILPFLLKAAQQEVVLECFGSIAGTRETFKKVSLCVSQMSGVQTSEFEPAKEYQIQQKSKSNRVFFQCLVVFELQSLCISFQIIDRAFSYFMVIQRFMK